MMMQLILTLYTLLICVPMNSVIIHNISISLILQNHITYKLTVSMQKCNAGAILFAN